MIRLILLRLLESYFRHRWLYLLPIVLMIAFAVIYYLTLKPVFNAEGVFFVQEESILSSITSLRETGYSWDTPAQNTLDEFNELLQTDSFVRSVIGKTELEQDMNQPEEEVDKMFGELRENVWLTTLGDNQIRISAAHENPLIAQQLVNASFDTFLQWKINIDQNEGKVAEDFLVALVAQYKVDVDQKREALDTYLLTHPQPLRGARPAIEELEIARLQSDVNLAEERYANALDKDEDAKLALNQSETAILQTYFLVDAPTIPTEPGTSLTDVVVNMAIFIVVGVILSAVGIVGGALLDRTLRFSVDVAYGLNLPVLTDVVDVPNKKS